MSLGYRIYSHLPSSKKAIMANSLSSLQSYTVHSVLRVEFLSNLERGGEPTSITAKSAHVVFFSHFCSILSIIHIFYRQGDEIWEQMRVSRVPRHAARLDSQGRFEVSSHNWFSNQFIEIHRRSIIVCFLSLSAKAGLNHRVHTEWQWPISGAHPIMDGKISPGWWGWGVHAHSLSLYLPSRTKL